MTSQNKIGRKLHLLFLFLTVIMVTSVPSQVTENDIPQHLKTKLNEALALVKEKNPQAAIQMIQKIIERNPSYYEAHHQLAIIYAGIKEYDQSIECFHRAMKIGKEKEISEASIYNSMGWVYFLKGDLKTSESCLLRAESEMGNMSPEYQLKTLNNLGTFYLHIRDFNRAEKYFLRAKTEFNSKLAERNLEHLHSIKIMQQRDYVQRGKDKFQQKNYLKANTYYTQALKMDPQDYKALNYKGYALYCQGKYNEALECLSQSYRINPKYFLTRLNMIKVLMALGKKDEAIQIIRREPKFTDEEKEKIRNDDHMKTIYKELLEYLD